MGARADRLRPRESVGMATCFSKNATHASETMCDDRDFCRMLAENRGAGRPESITGVICVRRSPCSGHADRLRPDEVVATIAGNVRNIREPRPETEEGTPWCTLSSFIP